MQSHYFAHIAKNWRNVEDSSLLLQSLRISMCAKCDKYSFYTHDHLTNKHHTSFGNTFSVSSRIANHFLFTIAFYFIFYYIL